MDFKQYFRVFYFFLAMITLLVFPLEMSFAMPILENNDLVFSAESTPLTLADNTFVYNPKTLRWTAISDKGQVVRSGRASGGRSYCPDIKRSCRTPIGTYRVMSKRGVDCHSTRYPVGRGGAPMPYCMFFSKYYAIHGSPDVPNYNASHGCIRVPPSDARWLNQNFIKVGTKVIVKPY